MGAIDAIIARGFGPDIRGIGTAYSDSRNTQNAADANLRSAEINQQGAQINQQNAVQDQQYQAQDRQAAQDQAAKLNAIYGRAQELAALPQDDSQVQAQWREIALGVEQLKSGGGKSIVDMFGLNPSAGAGFGNVNPGDYTPESLARYAQTRNYSDLVRQYAPPGQVLVNTPGFGVGLVDKGNPSNRTMLTTPGQEAQAKSDAAASQANAKEGAKTHAAAVADLPRIEANAEEGLSVLNQLRKAPGLSMIYGAASLAPIIPGTKQADAYALWEQLQGKAFLEAFTSLKGGGQITEVEGKKATAAITRLANRKISSKAAAAAMNDFESVIKKGVERARAKANAGVGSGNYDYVPGQGLVQK